MGMMTIPDKYTGKEFTAECDPSGETMYRLVPIPARLSNQLAAAFVTNQRYVLDADGKPKKDARGRDVTTADVNEVGVLTSLALFSLKEIKGVYKGGKGTRKIKHVLQFEKSWIGSDRDLERVTKASVDVLPPALWQEILLDCNDMYKVSDDHLAEIDFYADSSPTNLAVAETSLPVSGDAKKAGSRSRKKSQPKAKSSASTPAAASGKK